MSNSQSTEYHYFQWLVDHDISGGTVQFTLDEGTTWLNSTYIAVGSLPTSIAQLHADNPAPAGYSAYWFRVLLGPAVSNGVLEVGQNRVVGRVTDTPEIPWRHWIVVCND